MLEVEIFNFLVASQSPPGAIGEQYQSGSEGLGAQNLQIQSWADFKLQNHSGNSIPADAKGYYFT